MAGSATFDEPSTSTNAVSLSSLENVKSFLIGVQKNLRDVFVSDRPRLEVAIFHSVFEIFDSKIGPYIAARQRQWERQENLPPPAVSECNASASNVFESQQILVEGKYILDYALQDVFACLLFLMTEECIESSEEEERCAGNSTDISSNGVKSAVFPVPTVFTRDDATHRNSSLYYVSKSQRLSCAKLFFFLCWCPVVSSEAVIRALYPLLLSHPAGPPRRRAAPNGNATDEKNADDVSMFLEGTLENHIAENLLEGERFAWRRRFVVQTLNGVIMYRPHGIQSLYKVFIFTDKINPATGSLHEATDCIHRLLLSDMKDVWKPIQSVTMSQNSNAGTNEEKISKNDNNSDNNNNNNNNHGTTSTTNQNSNSMTVMTSQRSASAPLTVAKGVITLEEHYQIICQQLVELFTAQKDTEDHVQLESISCVEATQRQRASTHSAIHKGAAMVPPPQIPSAREETFEDRLHLALVLLLNRLLHLPAGVPTAHPTYVAAYKRYCFTNRYFLTPAFGSLTLRSSSVDLERVEKAVDRLCTLVHGVQLGAASLALDTIIEVAIPGLLNLAAIRERLPDKLVRRLSQIWEWIETENLSVDLIAEAAVRACFMVTKKQYVAPNNLMEHSLSIKDAPCPLYRLLTGLFRSVLKADILGGDAVSSPHHMDTGTGSLLQSKTMNAFARHCQYLSSSLTSYAVTALTLTGALEQQQDNEDDEEIRVLEEVNRRLAESVVESTEAVEETSSNSCPSLGDGRSAASRIRLAVFFLETYLESAPAAFLFGPQATLRHTFELLLVVLPLSSKCRAWSVTLADHLLSAILVAGSGMCPSSSVVVDTDKTPSETALGQPTGNTGDDNRLSLPRRAEERCLLRSLLSKFKFLLLSHPDGTPSTAAISTISNSSSASDRSSPSPADLAMELKLDVVMDLLSKKDDAVLFNHEGTTGDSASSPEVSAEALSAIHTLHQAVLEAMGRQGAGTTSLSVALSQLSSKVEDICLTGSHRHTRSGESPVTDIVALIRESIGKTLMDTLFHLLECISDTYSAVSAIKVLCWMGMYRWDSPDSSLLAAKLWSALLREVSAPPLGLRAGAPLQKYERESTFKVRLLDVLLAWCDYDHQGRTLRHMDDYGLRVHHRSVFDLLSWLCQAQQPDVVQVAALHCLGHYFPAVYPRVSLWKLSRVCQDVFRHTRIEMSKAACAAMLLQVCRALTFTDVEVAEGDEDSIRHVFQRDQELREIRQIANAMATYYSLPPTASTASSGCATGSQAKKTNARQSGGQRHKEESEEAPAVLEDHSAVVRRHGQAIQELLSTLDLLPLQVVQSS